MSVLPPPPRIFYRNKSYRTTINFSLVVYLYTLTFKEYEPLYKPPYWLRWPANYFIFTSSLIIIILKVHLSRTLHFTNSFKKLYFFSPVLCFILEAEVIGLLNVWILEKLEWPSFAPLLMEPCVQRREAQRGLAPGHPRWVRQLPLHSNILASNLPFWNTWNYILNSN